MESIHYRAARCRRRKVSYREAGPSDAPTLLLLHAFPTAGHMFRDLIPLLADSFHLVARLPQPSFWHIAGLVIDSRSLTSKKRGEET
jgi:pimeloyl-ACP methyl ester carboxylesterase